MRRIPEAILQAGNRLCWDVDPRGLDPERHEDFVLGRVLSEGTAEMVRALRQEVGDEVLRAFVMRAPHRLDSRTRRFLQVVLGANSAKQQEPCTTTPFRRSSDVLFSP
jgi:hypothetical protein